MFTHLSAIFLFMLDAFRQTWPLLLITIPIAVAVQVSGASRYIRRAFGAKPIAAVFLATAVGAFSPFCSCSVIPVIASLLIGGVPLAPVMSFWIASPSMDPEAFFLSVAMIGWDLAVWRLAATVLLSLGAGLATHFLVKKGWLGENILRAQRPPRVSKGFDLLRSGWDALKARQFAPAGSRLAPPALLMPAEAACCGQAPSRIQISDPGLQLPVLPQPAAPDASACGEGSCSVPMAPGAVTQGPPFWQRLSKETVKAVLMVLQFMTLAFFLEAVIQLYVPEAWIAAPLGRQNEWSIFTAALLGVPVYTSNLTALPLVSGLLAQGMNPAAAIAFLIAGPTTTLPAMSAVWGLVNRRVFALYIAFSFFGALAFGYLYTLLHSF